jgi:hypothetical protein
VDESLVSGELIDISRVTTIARSTSLAVDNHLGGKSNWSSSAQVIHDVESIGKSGG